MVDIMSTKGIITRQNLAKYKSYFDAHRLPIFVGAAIFLILVVFFTNYQYFMSGTNTTLGNESVNVTVYKGECSSCHNKSLSSSGINKAGCASCHQQAPHGDPKPPSRFNDEGKKTIHSRHSSGSNQKYCQSCHVIPTCNRCHAGHVITPDFNISRVCQDCHGNFPDPLGHQDQRLTFKDSAHSWMGRCTTCHKGNELGFKSLSTYSLANSSQLCHNCHSAQYNDPKHYSMQNVSGNMVENKKCVDCHNPHAVLGGGFTLSVPSGVKTGFNGLIEIIINNAAWVVLIIILIMSSVIEYIFKPQKGNVILSKGLKVEYDQSKARSIRITSHQKLNSSVLRELTNILDENNIELLGISAGNEETVLFISAEAKDREKVIVDLRSVSGILKVGYTKDYDNR